MQDLSLYVLDIAQNALAAEATLTGIAVERRGDLLTVTLSDNGRGMDEETAGKAVDPFYTTRTTRDVGMGLPLFKMAAEQTGGSFSLTSRPGEGTTVKATFHMDHIDAPPTGDMAATVTSMAAVCGETDFVFTCAVDDGAFTLDTREIRDIMQGIPLQTPQVLSFLKDYVSEHLAQFSGR